DHFPVRRILETDHWYHAGWRGLTLCILGSPASVVARFVTTGALLLPHDLELVLARIAIVGFATPNEILRDLAIAAQPLHLIERPLVVIEIQPLHGVQNRLGGCLRGALAIGVFDAQNELTPM